VGFVEQALLLELQKHLKFEAQPQLIKKRIESLLEREYVAPHVTFGLQHRPVLTCARHVRYLERDAQNSSIYHYTA